jgi:hypothetical protein
MVWTGSIPQPFDMRVRVQQIVDRGILEDHMLEFTCAFLSVSSKLFFYGTLLYNYGDFPSMGVFNMFLGLISSKEFFRTNRTSKSPFHIFWHILPSYHKVSINKYVFLCRCLIGRRLQSSIYGCRYVFCLY